MNTNDARSLERAPVLVGVDGSVGNLAAVRWAAREAAGRGVVLRAVCVLDDYSVLSPELHARAVRPWATRALELADSAAKEVAPGVRVSTEELGGPPGVVLTEEARGAGVLVVGRRGTGGFASVLLGSTATTAASHADVTAVVVPDEWPTEHDAPVVVGAGHGDDPLVLETAFTHARWLGLPLQVLHAWEVHPELTWDTAMVYGQVPAWEAEHKQRVDEVVEPWTAKFPEVDVRVEVKRGHPAELLSAASAHGSLLVVGAHHRRHPQRHQRLGSIARAVLHHAACPVMVVRG